MITNNLLTEALNNQKTAREYFLELIPKSKPPVTEDGFWVVKRKLDGWNSAILDTHFIETLWRELYRDAVAAVAEMQLSANEKTYYHVNYSPIVKYPWEAGDPYEIMVRIEVFVSGTHKIKVPVLIYDIQGRVIEWRCGYCDTPNEIADRNCTQCGAPRAKLLQEMW